MEIWQLLLIVIAIILILVAIVRVDPNEEDTDPALFDRWVCTPIAILFWTILGGIFWLVLILSPWIIIYLLSYLHYII
jgi:hypothetical protein